MSAHCLRYVNLASNLQPLISEDDLISAVTLHYPIHVQKSMIGCNLKNTQDALNYLSKMEALDGQPNFKRDRLSLDQQDYNPGPRHCQATEQSDERCRTDVQVRQINYSGGGQSNSR